MLQQAQAFLFSSLLFLPLAGRGLHETMQPAILFTSGQAVDDVTKLWER
jgi:hypothetical protein